MKKKYGILMTPTKIKTYIRRGWECILELIYPTRCPFCDEPLLKSERPVCAFCSGQIEWATEPYCMKCGKVLQDAETEYCADCRSYHHFFERGRSVFVYKGPVKKSIYRFKYAGRKEYAKAYAMLAQQHLGGYVRKVAPDALVPVPLHRKRYNRRGYNQARLFATALGNRMGIPVYADLVKRTRNTLPQKMLERSERQNNLKKAFKINRNDVKLNTIIIIDDIYTTGSTIDALAEVLREAGVEKIFFLTISGGRLQ